ncbi:MAG: hypothetical protein AAGN35_26325 [Bacteroidota bacterium]
MMQQTIRSGLLTLIVLLLGGLGSVLELKAQPPHDPQTFVRNFTWHYQGERYTAQIALSWEAYNYYKDLPRVYEGYAVYIQEHPRYPYIAEVTRVLQCAAGDHQLNRWETLEMIVAFVQQLEYVREEGEYPRFPIETLAEQGGDCEDSSLLLAGLLREMGYDVILVNPPGHMGIALACSNCTGTAYRHQGRRYFYIETTSAGFPIGEMPAGYTTTHDKVIDLDAPLDHIRMLSMSPATARPGANYYVQEDGATRQVCLQPGKCVTATQKVRHVLINGATSRKILFTSLIAQAK